MGRESCPTQTDNSGILDTLDDFLPGNAGNILFLTNTFQAGVLSVIINNDAFDHLSILHTALLDSLDLAGAGRDDVG